MKYIVWKSEKGTVALFPCASNVEITFWLTIAGGDAKVCQNLEEAKKELEVMKGEKE